MVQKVKGMGAKQEMDTLLIVLAGFFITRKKTDHDILRDMIVYS